MKRFVAFTAILAGSFCYYIFACGPQYPYGEEVRFSILDPKAFPHAGFGEFCYTSRLFQPYGADETDTSSYEWYSRNIELWRAYCKNKVSFRDANTAVYQLSADDINNPRTNNTMIKYLHAVKDKDAVDYLQFAKQCETLNAFYGDPWEKTEDLRIPARDSAIAMALNGAAKVNNKILQLRYAFLAIRLAFYNTDSAAVANVYDRYFRSRKDLNIIDYWALHFRTMWEKPGARRNLNAALVFANAPDKRFAIYRQYDKSIPLTSTLSLAGSNSQRVAIWLLDGVRTPDKALNSIRNIYSLTPSSEALDFLLLREINKLEDWIYTPTYTYFAPSISQEDSWDMTSEKALSNVEKDKLYAGELLKFIITADVSKTDNPVLWQTAKAYLHCMLREYQQALSIIDSVSTTVKKDDPRYKQLMLIEGLCLTAIQPANNAAIPSKIKPLLLEQHKLKNYKFIFAIAKELEAKGNRTDAALLISKVNNQYGLSEDFWSNGVFWRTKKNYNTLLLDYYYDYFFYIDAQYTSDQVNTMIKSIKDHTVTENSFDTWLYSIAKKDLGRLYDLLGTKYVRENNLNNALAAFSKVNDTLWNSSSYFYKDYLNANPFYTNLYNEHTPTKADTVKFTKTKIVGRLLDHLSKANNPNTPNRDYHYFLAANCYLNMTQYGNSWMMRRYFWTSRETKTQLHDDPEYFQCNLAKRYYLKAKEVTKSPKFAALCLRMAGRCEKYRLGNVMEQQAENMSWENYRDELFKRNQYYSQLKKQYPGDYDELISNCESFERYFRSR